MNRTLAFGMGLMLCAAVCQSVLADDSATIKSAGADPVPGVLTAMQADLPKPKPAGFFSKTDELDDSAREKMSFLLFLPTCEDAKSDAGYPLLLFLHGIGERGDNPEVLKAFGPAKICASPDRAKEWPFLTVAPQCPKDHFWSAAQLRFLIDKVCEEYPVDRSRIYATGLSMGGFGVWSILRSYPEIIAAAAPICGGGDPESASKMVGVPIWAFHGEKDPLVPCALSREMIAKLKDAGAQDARLTIYPGVGHNSWDKAYEEKDLYSWMLSKRLKADDPQSRKESE